MIIQSSMGKVLACVVNKEDLLSPKLKLYIYMPLIDMPPAHSDSIMTVTSKAHWMTQEIGQTFTLFTADQQLY